MVSIAKLTVPPVVVKLGLPARRTAGEEPAHLRKPYEVSIPVKKGRITKVLFPPGRFISENR